MNPLDDTRTAGDVHKDKMTEKILDLREEIERLKARVELLEAENHTLKTMIENARIKLVGAAGRK